MRYILPGLQLESDREFPSFAPFRDDSPCSLPLCTLHFHPAPAPNAEVLYQVTHPDFEVSALADGWLYVLPGLPEYALRVSADYSTLDAYFPVFGGSPERMLPLIRTALECAHIRQGVLSLHSACVELCRKAVCFTAPSGTGKSTRAASWMSGLGAQLISGDRPSIRVTPTGVIASGAPWDGKEQLFSNNNAPLMGICHIRRGEKTQIRKLSARQARQILCQQCFLPMWDTEVAVTAMGLIEKLVRTAPVYRVTCGPDENAAKEVWDILTNRPHLIREEELTLKIKEGFVLRNVSGEYMVMPAGQNIRDFNGAIVLNHVAAFIWDKLVDGCSREELLQDILSSFAVDRDRVETDLDALLCKLRSYQVLTEEN